MVHQIIKEGKSVEFISPVDSILELLERNAEKEEDKPALVYWNINNKQEFVLSHMQLLKAVNQTINYFSELKLDQGDTFSILMNNTPENLVLNLAAWASGVVVSPLSAKTDSVDTKIYKLRKIGSKILFTKPSTCPEIKDQLNIIKNKLPKLKIVELQEWGFFDEIKKSPVNGQLLNVNCELDQTSLILYTSGTTSLPKGVCLTPKSLLANADSIVDWLKLTSEDKFLIVLPLYHINSTVFCLSTLLTGGTIVLSSRYSKSRFWDLVEKYQATCTSIVPTILHDLVSDPSPLERGPRWTSGRGVFPLKRIQLGSAPVQPDVAVKFYKKFKIPLIQGYGQTETSLRSTGVPYSPLSPRWWNSPENDIHLKFSNKCRPEHGRRISDKDSSPGVDEAEYRQLLADNSIGTELKWTNVTILREDGTEAKEGEHGEICVRGPIIMEKYYDDEDNTKEAFKYDWFHSGDSGYFEYSTSSPRGWNSINNINKDSSPGVDGKQIMSNESKQKFFYITGRIKELIIKGGINISPLSVESALRNYYPEISQVFAFGIPDERFGEVVGAVVVPNRSLPRQHTSSSAKLRVSSQEEKIIADAQAGKIPGLSKYESPTKLFEIKKEDLPTTSTGKVQRMKLKEQFASHN